MYNDEAISIIQRLFSAMISVVSKREKVPGSVERSTSRKYFRGAILFLCMFLSAYNFLPREFDMNVFYPASYDVQRVIGSISFNTTEDQHQMVDRIGWVENKTYEVPPIPQLNIGHSHEICHLHGYELLCKKYERQDQMISAIPRYAAYVEDSNGYQVKRANYATNSVFDLRPLSTAWFHPDSSKCGPNPHLPYVRCANLGDEIGGILLSWFSGSPIEVRQDGMDVVIIGRVLNHIVSNYNRTVNKVGGRFNITVWGTGTKWGVGGVCFDFRAVRGPKTRKVFADVGCNIPEVYGDPALLLPFIYDPRDRIPVNTNIDMCIIPHMDDFSSHERFEWWYSINGTHGIASRFSHIDHEFECAVTKRKYTVRLIDIRTPNVASFVDALTSCKLVSSASLHGIILAEAYNITWSWVQLNQKTEKPFKYEDFFLSVGIQSGVNVSSFCLGTSSLDTNNENIVTCDFSFPPAVSSHFASPQEPPLTILYLILCSQRSEGRVFTTR